MADFKSLPFFILPDNIMIRYYKTQKINMIGV